MASGERIIRSAFVYAIFMDRAAERRTIRFHRWHEEADEDFLQRNDGFSSCRGRYGWCFIVLSNPLIFSGKGVSLYLKITTELYHVYAIIKDG